MSGFMDLGAAYDALPKPPWPLDAPCHWEGCGHRKDEHASPLVEDGRCLHAVAGCPCAGWDPLTKEQWAVAFEALLAGIR